MKFRIPRNTAFLIFLGFIVFSLIVCMTVSHSEIKKPNCPSECHQSSVVNMGAIFYCHKHPRATFKALQSFRRNYPDGTIVLVNDGGDDIMKKIASYFHALYFYINTTRFSLMGDTAEEMLANIHQYLNFVNLLPEPWFLRLEDDVVILRSVCEHELNYDVNMANRGNRWQDDVYTELLKFNPNAPNFWGFGGGAVARTAAFRELLKEPLRLNRTFNAFSKRYTALKFFDDMTFSFLLLSLNFTIDLPEFFSEVPWGVDWMRKLADSKLAVLHQAKAFYDDEFVEENMVSAEAT